MVSDDTKVTSTNVSVTQTQRVPVTVVRSSTSWTTCLCTECEHLSVTRHHCGQNQLDTLSHNDTCQLLGTTRCSDAAGWKDDCSRRALQRRKHHVSLLNSHDVWRASPAGVDAVTHVDVRCASNVTQWQGLEWSGSHLHRPASPL